MYLKKGIIMENIFEIIKKEFHAEPEYLWKSNPEYAVFRHSDNKKWFAISMKVSKDKLGINEDGYADIINVKCDPMLIDILLNTNGFFPAYHMNKKHWISVSLDGSVTVKQITDLINMSFHMTKCSHKLDKSIDK